jgi:hypothetical protein
MQTEANRLARMLMENDRPVMPINKVGKLIGVSARTAKSYCQRHGVEVLEFSRKRHVIFEDQFAVLLERVSGKQGAAA